MVTCSWSGFLQWLVWMCLHRGLWDYWPRKQWSLESCLQDKCASPCATTASLQIVVGRVGTKQDNIKYEMHLYLDSGDIIIPCLRKLDWGTFKWIIKPSCDFSQKAHYFSLKPLKWCIYCWKPTFSTSPQLLIRPDSTLPPSCSFSASPSPFEFHPVSCYLM